MNMRIFVFFGILLSILLFAVAADAQRRDYLTEQEIEIVREAQEIDLRIDVLVHAMDRRFAILNINVGNPVKEKKENDIWGPLPTGTRLELLRDIKRIMQKAIDDINNLAERPDSMVVGEPEKGRKPKTYADLFPKAVRSLAAAAARYEPVLKSELTKTDVKTEQGVLMDIIDSCTQIADALTKLPAEVKKAKN